MAKDDTSPGGLFSKMVKFVRSPGTQWNELDDPTSAKDGSLSKQALKEMIERKRRNDFVRKREFDMLRKLRNREVVGAGGPTDSVARPSFFQSSMPSRPDDRAMTLKKIDEIEAQMSMQWWKTKHGGPGGATSINQASDFSASDVNSNPPPNSVAAKSAAVANTLAFARTAPDDLASSVARSAAKFMPNSGSGGMPAGVPTITTLATPLADAPIAPIAAPVAPPAPIIFTTTPTPPVFAPAAAPIAQPAVRDDDNSLDFTPQAFSTGKPVIKTTPPAATPAIAAASPVAGNAAAAPVSQTTAAPFKPAASASGAPVQNRSIGGLAASYEASNSPTGFSASKLFAVEVGEVQHDPELEEAAIRFANLDDSGAESGLLEAVSPRGPRHQHEETWLALFDLYRAIGQYDRFESLALDFAAKFNRSAPNWFSIPDMVSKMTGTEPPEPTSSKKADWRSPAIFGIQTLAALSAALAKAPMPWTLDWRTLQTIEDNAVVPLTKLMLGWATQPVQLRIAHAQKLEDVLRQGTPSGVQTVDKARWDLLMTYMRIAHRPDEFELAALDFCVTYEVSPPSWEAARCDFKILDDEGNTGVGHTIVGEVTHDSIMSEMHTEGGTSMVTAQLATVELSGQIMGEPKPVLDKLEARLTGADMMMISCAKLVRVDFSAAGSLLNWVTARQAEGRIVQFTDVHRLVAAFFHVIGISEHAKVSTRVD
jgi:ABC-type transporter Mla MlaB component